MADKHNTLTQECLHELFEYRDGCLYWRISIGSKIKIGSIAGYRSKTNNRSSIQIYKKVYLIHRIIYLFHYGYIPQFLDHIDNNPQNNKIENLRPATRLQNSYNRKLNANNKSGVKGVYWRKNIKKYIARCTVNSVRYNLGHFVNLEEAKKVIDEFRLKNHKEFARFL